ncbi:MAG: hypothetical protein ACAI34_16915 [Verrucomicrobium sp.]
MTAPLQAEAKSVGRSALFFVILLIWVVPPLLAWLGWLGYIHESLPLRRNQFVDVSGVLRLKKGILPPLSPTDARHAIVTEGQQPLRRKANVYELSDSLAKGAYLIREPFLYIKPFTPAGTGGDSVQGYNLMLPWRAPGWYWAAWASSVAGTLLLLRKARLLEAFRTGATGAAKAWPAWNERSQRKGWYLAAYATLVTLGIAVTYEDKLVTPYLSAEDGMVFLQENLGHGIQAFWIPYAGYLHALPRMGAWLAGFFPMEHQAAVMVWYSLVIMWGVGYGIARWTSDWRERLALAGFLVLAPMGGYMMLSPTNLQWFTGIALTLLAIHADPAPSSRLKKATLIVAALLAALSGPFAIIALPGMVFRTWRVRSRFNLLLAATQGLAVVVQLVFLFNNEPDPTTPPSSRPALVSWVADFSLGLFGKALSWSPAETAPWGIAVTGLLAVCFCGALMLWKGPREGQVRLVLLLAFASLFAAAGWVRSDGGSSSWGGGERYYVVPYALLVIALASLFPTRSRWLQVAGVALLGCLFTGLVHTPMPQIQPPNWVQKVREITPGSSGFIEIHPAAFKWSVFIVRDADGKLLAGEAYLKAEREARAKAEALMRAD